MQFTVRFIEQASCEDVNVCVEDITMSGGEVLNSSFFQDSQFVDINFEISNPDTFHSYFVNTSSYPKSDWQQ